MRKFNVSINGNNYEVEVEEILNNLSAPLARGSASRNIEKTKTPTEKPIAKESISSEPAKQKKTAVKASSPSSVSSETIAAPLPGAILSINVKVGDKVSKGTVLLILEAMKMENEIMSNGDGVVSEIKVQPGNSVNAGDVLIVIS